MGGSRKTMGGNPMIFFTEEKPDEYWADGMRYVYDNLDENLACAWGGSLSESAKKLAELNTREYFECGYTEKKKVWFYAGGPLDVPIIHSFDLVFCEDRWTQREFRKRGVDAKIAFGINTQTYHKINCEKTWDYIYPAAFAAWKRHDLFIGRVLRERATGLCVGQHQQHESFIYDACRQNGITVLPKVTPEAVNWLYNQSVCAYLPADLMGGCQRAAWEAKYLGLDVIVENERLKELLEEPVKTEVEYLETVQKEIRKLCA